MNASHRKLGALLLLLTISVCVAIPALAFQNEPDGFRGLKWGTNIKKLPDMVFLEREGDVKIYYRKFDKLKIEDVYVDEIVYHFYRNQFCAVQISFDSFTNFAKLKSILFGQHGQSDQANLPLEKYLWFGGNVEIDFEYNEREQKGDIFYIFKPIYEEKKRRDKEKAKEGRSD